MKISGNIKSLAKVSAGRAAAAFSIGALFYAMAFVQRVAPSVMTGELMRDFAVGAAALGTLSGWYFYTYAGIQIPVGMLNDRFGPRKLMSVAAAVCAIGSFGFGLSETVAAASFFRAVIGVSVAFAFVGTLTIAGYWFAPARFAMLAGVVLAVGMCGAMLGQAPLRFALEHLGWRTAMHLTGVAAAVLAVLLFYIVPRRPRKNNDDGGGGGGGGAQQKNNGGGGRSGVMSVLANVQSWNCAGAGFGMPAIGLAFAGLWAVPWLNTVHDYAVSQAAWVASMLFLGWAVGAPLVGWLSDYIGKRRPVMLVGVIGNLAVFSFVLYGEVSGVAAMAFLFFLLGVCGSPVTVALGAMREVNSKHHSATALGLVNMCIVGSAAVLQPIIGWLLDIAWDGAIIDGARIYSATAYSTAFSVLLAANVLSLVCVVLLRETYCRAVGE